MRDMSWSVKLFSVNGIPVRIHFSFLLILFWAAYSGYTSGSRDWVKSAVFMLVFLLLLFVCVTLHELGHSLVAQLFGARVVDITLLPIGGLARMAKIPERPYQEFVMAAAGPVTNIVLAIGLGVLFLAWAGPGEIVALAEAPWLLSAYLSEMNAQTLLLLLVANNIVLAIFNLIPAFPLDGGRMLRALLAAVLPYRRATAIAAYVGQTLALVLGMAALLDGNFFLGFVALFVFVSAWQEREQIRSRADLQGYQVRQAMQPVGLRLHPLQTLGDLGSQLASSTQATYLVIDGGRLVGLMSRSDLLTALRRGGPEARLNPYIRRAHPQVSPDDDLAAVGERLAQGGDPAPVVVEDGQVVGVIGRADLARLAEVAAAHPKALSRGSSRQIDNSPDSRRVEISPHDNTDRV